MEVVPLGLMRRMEMGLVEWPVTHGRGREDIWDARYNIQGTILLDIQQDAGW